MTTAAFSSFSTDAEAAERGLSARKEMRRSAHSQVSLATGRDPFAIISAQNQTRQQDLIGLRWKRMLTDPFAFYRGTAAIMAADLAAGPSTGLDVVACGDAHLANFGFYASPQRTLVFDLNDFDEAAVAPWEWDVKRLAVSFAMGALQNGHGETGATAAAATAARAYREQLAAMVQLTVLQRYYILETVPDRASDTAPKQARRILDDAVAKARKSSSDRVAKQLSTTLEDGSRQFVEDPPVLTRIAVTNEDVQAYVTAYLASVRPDVALLLSQYRLDDIARRVVGVGSVGTRCLLLMLRGPSGEPLVLQIKEAGQSVLESHGHVGQPDFFGPIGSPDREGRRVVSYQHVLQASSDPFLGHFSLRGFDFYVRQFHDMKGGIDVAGLGGRRLHRLRERVRPNPGAGPRPEPQRDRDLQLPGRFGHLRPGHRQLLPRLRRASRRRLRGSERTHHAAQSLTAKPLALPTPGPAIARPPDALRFDDAVRHLTGSRAGTGGSLSGARTGRPERCGRGRGPPARSRAATT